MTHWHSLYLWSEQTTGVAHDYTDKTMNSPKAETEQDSYLIKKATVESIQQYLESEAYIPYNPFGRYPGMAYPITIKTFVAPVQNACVRVFFEGHELDALAIYLSHQADCLAIALDGTQPLVHFYRAGELLELSALKAYCKPNCEVQLETVLNADVHHLSALNQDKIGDVPLDALSDDIQQMAKQVDSKQANNLFNKLKNQFVKAAGQHDVKALLQSESDWNSQGGQYIRALMACLNVPDFWREPDFSTLRRAFAVQSRQQFDTNTPLFPGDAESIMAVPNALDYVPVYGGKRE